MGVEIAHRAVGLAEILLARSCPTWRSSRQANIANSLPTVVGDAAWPWVRAIIATSS